MQSYARRVGGCFDPDLLAGQAGERKTVVPEPGLLNLILPFFGGMPMCHGAGSLAGQYYFGARTGGTNIIEGIIEISLGLFLAASVAGLFRVFPMPIIGAMMLFVGLELTKFATKVRTKDIARLGATVAASLVTNMAFGFVAGLGVYYGIRYLFRHTCHCVCHQSAAAVA